MSLFTPPTSYRLARMAPDAQTAMAAPSGFDDAAVGLFKAHSSHPDFGHLVLLVFEAVLEVVCVSLPGYIVARQGMFDADAQKFVANLNVMVFTPCLIFTKLASQLSTDKLVELAVIPIIFVAQTLISYLCSVGTSRLFRFKRRQRNFVIAMGVFGNSNSLPISLVLSLSKTLKGLHWDKIPGDNDDEVAARGILYLLIFQQLGQLVRWSWGYHVLLAPPEKYTDDEGGTGGRAESGTYHDDPSHDEQRELLLDVTDSEDEENATPKPPATSDYGSGAVTPARVTSSTTSLSTSYSSPHDEHRGKNGFVPSPNGDILRHESANHITAFPSPPHSAKSTDFPAGPKGWWMQTKVITKKISIKTSTRVKTASRQTYSKLPPSVQKVLSKTYSLIARFLHGLWEFMNPPLWAMLAAVIVASTPELQHLFYDKGTFINNSITRAVSQSGSVAVPLILVVLGANLARNTIPKDQLNADNPKEERNLLIAALVSRMLFPTIIMSPVIALMAKYVPVSILDDPIFVIVCFLLTGAPSALQLAQICQINNVYMGAMARLLFQSYVVWILPSTLVLVMLALEVVEWAVI